MSTAEAGGGQTFDVIVEARQNSVRKGVATIMPGEIRLDVDEKAIYGGHLASYLDDVFRGSPGTVEINLKRVRPVRCLGTRIIYFLPEQGHGIGLSPAGVRNQKESMANFIHAIEAASGQAVVTEDLKHLRLAGLILGAVVLALGVAALMMRLMNG